MSEPESPPTAASAPRRLGNPRMVAGGPSLNPKGRPPSGRSLAERFRWIADPDELCRLLLSIARDTKEKTSDRITAAQAVLDRGWGRATQTIDAHLSTTTVAPRDFSSMPIEERRALLERVRQLPVARDATAVDDETSVMP